jgi:hypothetical protein
MAASETEAAAERVVAGGFAYPGEPKGIARSDNREEKCQRVYISA